MTGASGIPAGVELRHLRYFLAVADELHFGRAAARLHMAQPPLSQQIQKLESMLRCRLFDRRPRVRLTPAGVALREAADLILHQLDVGLREVAQSAGGEQGVLTVGFAASTLPTALAAGVRQFRERYPQVELRLQELSTSAQTQALRDRRIDVGFLREAERWPEIECEVLLREPFVAVLPPGSPLAARRRLPLGSLAGEPFIHFPRSVAPALHDRVISLCSAAGFAPRIVQEAREWLTIIGLVEANVGVSLAPASFRRLRWGGVKYRPICSGNAVTEVALCTGAGADSPLVMNFRATVRQAFRGSRDGGAQVET